MALRPGSAQAGQNPSRTVPRACRGAVIERQLAHAERNAVSAAYNFAEHLPERRKMMQAWADYLDGLKAGAQVIPLFNTGDTGVKHRGQIFC